MKNLKILEFLGYSQIYFHKKITRYICPVLSHNLDKGTCRDSGSSLETSHHGNPTTSGGGFYRPKSTVPCYGCSKTVRSCILHTCKSTSVPSTWAICPCDDPKSDDAGSHHLFHRKWERERKRKRKKKCVAFCSNIYLFLHRNQ